jgi:integrase
VTGKRRVRFVTVRGGKREAQRRLTELLGQVQRGDHPSATAGLTVGAYLETWLADHIAQRVSAKTLERYSEIVRAHLVPALRAVPLAKLTPMQIQAAHAAALTGGRRQPKANGLKGLAAQTVKHHHRVLSQALKQAVRLGLIARNPAERVDPPRPARTEMKILDPAQTAALLAAAEHSFAYVPIVLAVATGARRGEVLGLRWADVDLERATASIAQTLEETDRGGLAFKPRNGFGPGATGSTTASYAVTRSAGR